MVAVNELRGRRRQESRELLENVARSEAPISPDVSLQCGLAAALLGRGERALAPTRSVSNLRSVSDAVNAALAILVALASEPDADDALVGALVAAKAARDALLWDDA